MAALLGSGGMNPDLAAQLKSGDPRAVAKFLAHSPLAKAAAKTAEVAGKAVCRLDSRVRTSSGGPTVQLQGAKSLKCSPLPPAKASGGKAVLARALRAAKGAAAKRSAALSTAVTATVGTKPSYQPVLWAGASLKVANLVAAFNALGVGNNSELKDVVNLINTVIPPIGSVTAVVAASSDDADLAQLPAGVLPDALAYLGGGTTVSKGLTIQVAAAAPKTCPTGAKLCKFLLPYLADASLTLSTFIPGDPTAAAYTTAVAINDITLGSRFTLQQVALTATTGPPPAAASLGVSGALAVTVQGRNTLLFAASVAQAGSPPLLKLGGSMIGTWQGAFGWDQLDVKDLILTADVAPGPALQAVTFQGSAAVYKPGTKHDGCGAGGAAATAQHCLAINLAMGYDTAAEPPTAYFYAKLTSVELGHGLKLGALPCIFAGTCLHKDDPLDVVLNAVSISKAVVSFSDTPQSLTFGRQSVDVPVGLSITGAASIGGVFDVALNIVIDSKTKSGKVAGAASGNAADLVLVGAFAKGDQSASYIYASFNAKVRVGCCGVWTGGWEPRPAALPAPRRSTSRRPSAGSASCAISTPTSRRSWVRIAYLRRSCFRRAPRLAT